MVLTQINIKLDLDTKLWLIKYGVENGGYSLLIRDLITDFRIKIQDPEAIKKQIIEYQNKIKNLESLENKKNIDNSRIKDILEYHSHNYKLNATLRTEKQRFEFLKRTVLPQIKPIGYKGSLEELDDLLINWPTEEGNEI
ncbi:MAG: hypothetical protein ACFFDH_18365 [Promethearchaeota archaeon]